MTSTPRRSRHFHLPFLLRFAASVTAAGALVLGGGDVAHAESWSHADPAHDVQKTDITSESGNHVAAPGYQRSDIRRVRVIHGENNVIVRVTTRRYLPRAFWWQTVATIRTPDARFSAFVTKFDGPRTMVLAKGRSTIDCAGLRFAGDRERERLEIVVPRKCLGAPRWVRVGAAAIAIEDKWMYVDDGLSRRIGDPPTLSPRVRQD